MCRLRHREALTIGLAELCGGGAVEPGARVKTGDRTGVAVRMCDLLGNAEFGLTTQRRSARSHPDRGIHVQSSVDGSADLVFRNSGQGTDD